MLTPRRSAALIAAGRIALGSAVLASPKQVTSRWLGKDNAEHPAVGALARGLAARDIALGLAALRTLDDRRAGPYVQLGCALADGADALGTALARKHLPRAGAAATIVLASAASAASLAAARAFAQRAS